MWIYTGLGQILPYLYNIQFNIYLSCSHIWGYYHVFEIYFLVSIDISFLSVILISSYFEIGEASTTHIWSYSLSH